MRRVLGPHDKTRCEFVGQDPSHDGYSKKVAIYWPHYNNIGLIAKFLLTEYPDAILSSPDKRKYFNVESGFFNFIDQVINQDMYAYSIFPRLDAYSTLRAEENEAGSGRPWAERRNRLVRWQHSQSAARAALETAAIGFTDAERTNSIDFGWVIDIGPEGGAVQKSQFALISVPAWTERLEISVVDRLAQFIVRGTAGQVLQFPRSNSAGLRSLRFLYCRQGNQQTADGRQ